MPRLARLYEWRSKIEGWRFGMATQGTARAHADFIAAVRASSFPRLWRQRTGTPRRQKPSQLSAPGVLQNRQSLRPNTACAAGRRRTAHSVALLLLNEYRKSGGQFRPVLLVHRLTSAIPRLRAFAAWINCTMLLIQRQSQSREKRKDSRRQQ